MRKTARPVVWEPWRAKSRQGHPINFAISECNNMIAMLNFQPQRFEELKQRIREGRVELCNAFFLEPTINLSGGEALVKMGVEGLRWQQAMFGVRPRLAWMIDVTGVHEQMAQISAGLGLDGFAYCRHNPTGYAIHWAESPDGTRSLAVAPGPYADWKGVFNSAVPLAEKQLAGLQADLRWRANPVPLTPEEIVKNASPGGGERRRAPVGAPLLLFGGSADYSLAPLHKPYPTEFLQQFKQVAPEFDVQFATPSKYLDAILPGIQSGAIKLPVMRGGTLFNYNAFWIQNPRVKSWFRRCEHQLQAAEMLATAASLRGPFEYPAQDLYHAWLLLCLNMDRATLWGNAAGMVFEDESSWDARDRFEWVEKTSRDIATRALRSLLGPGDATIQFNPLNWTRSDFPELAACSTGPESAPAATKDTSLPAVIETKFYSAHLDPVTGALASLKLKPSGREVLGGPANVVVVEGRGDPDHMFERSERNRITDSNVIPVKLTVTASPLKTVVEAESSLAGAGRLLRKMVFSNIIPRIDFETELNDLPGRTVVVAEFPLASPVQEVRRGIPYGFAHAAWATPNPDLPGLAKVSGPVVVRCRATPNPDMPGFAKGITPAVRWSHYQMADAGVALLDQGLTGREITGNTPILFLYNASDTYRGFPSAWLSGAGRHTLRYALIAHEGNFAGARIPQTAWEFNSPPIEATGCEAADMPPILQTSDNVIVEALRREGSEIELRMAECLGRAGTARVTLNLPHLDAALTNLLGEQRQPLAGGPAYEFPVRPQQIVTMRFKTTSTVPSVEPLTQWDEFVPEKKREALHRYFPDVKGHPPRRPQPVLGR